MIATGTAVSAVRHLASGPLGTGAASQPAVWQIAAANKAAGADVADASTAQGTSSLRRQDPTQYR